MAAKSVIHRWALTKRLPKQKLYRRMVALIPLVVMVITLAACSETISEPNAIMTNTPHASPTSKPTITPSSTTSPTRTPSPTQNPFGTQIGSTPIKHEESLLEHIDVPVTYHAVFENLPSGVYIVDRKATRGISFPQKDHLRS
jgi:hypothetical protein